MRNLMIMFFVMAALVLAVGCGKKGPEGEGGEGGDQPAVEKPDLSSAKSAFEGFAKRLHKLTTDMEAEIKSLRNTKEFDVLKPAITQEYYDFMKKQYEKYAGGEDFRKEGAITFEKEEKGEDGAVIIYGVQKNTRNDRSRDPETGKRITKPKEVTKKHKVVLAQENGEWRVKEWWQQCYACKGSGKCPECEGTGKTIEKPCPACDGTGKMDGNKCYACQGTGKTKVRDCTACKETGGKCPSCKGEGWDLQDKWGDDDFFLDGEFKFEKVSSYDTPANAAKSYFSLRMAQEAKQVEFMKKLAKMMHTMVKDFCVKKIQDEMAEGLKKGAASFKEKNEGQKRTFGEAMVDGDTAAVPVTMSFTRKGKTDVDKSALKLKKVGDAWKVDDRGSSCFQCKGTGKCSQCKGTGKVNGQECYACKKHPGKCMGCKGEKFNWMRAR